MPKSNYYLITIDGDVSPELDGCVTYVLLNIENEKELQILQKLSQLSKKRANLNGELISPYIDIDCVRKVDYVDEDNKKQTGYLINMEGMNEISAWIYDPIYQEVCKIPFKNIDKIYL